MFFTLSDFQFLLTGQWVFKTCTLTVKKKCYMPILQNTALMVD